MVSLCAGNIYVLLPYIKLKIYNLLSQLPIANISSSFNEVIQDRLELQILNDLII